MKKALAVDLAQSRGTQDDGWYSMRLGRDIYWLDRTRPFAECETTAALLTRSLLRTHVLQGSGALRLRQAWEGN